MAMTTKIYTNIAVSGDYPLKATLLAGRDFNILTHYKNSFCERWIFPINFLNLLVTPSEREKALIGRMVRSCSTDTVVEHASVQTMTETDQNMSDLDGDFLFSMKAIEENGLFSAVTHAGQKVATSIFFNPAKENYRIELQADDAIIKFEVERISSPSTSLKAYFFSGDKK